MEMYDAMFSASFALNERIASAVFEVLPECAPLVAIVDRDGNCWPSDSEAFEKLNLSETLLSDLRAQVDDGVEPATAQVGDAAVTMVQLSTEHTNCGYLVLAIGRAGSDSIPAGLGAIETIVALIALAARLVEKESLLGEAQIKCYSVYGTAQAPAN
ncbi:MAG: hypothetical protein JW993_10045 [Sedimentisphaerales bacterium]|nr:hypothetical protein [Sedimentisphaerales bacterium]